MLRDERKKIPLKSTSSNTFVWANGKENQQTPYHGGRQCEREQTEQISRNRKFLTVAGVRVTAGVCVCVALCVRHRADNTTNNNKNREREREQRGEERRVCD